MRKVSKEQWCADWSQSDDDMMCLNGVKKIWKYSLKEYKLDLNEKSVWKLFKLHQWNVTESLWPTELLDCILRRISNFLIQL